MSCDTLDDLILGSAMGCSGNSHLKIWYLKIILVLECSSSQTCGYVQSEPLFIGISRRAMNVRPTAFFYIKCSLTSSQVQEFYEQAADGYESSSILLVSQVYHPIL